jgi:hypothetical protein
MFNLPLIMREDLAALVKDPQIKALLLLPDQELQEELDRMGQQLRARGVPVGVVVAYQALAPLLWEADAVRAYHLQKGSSEIMMALPEVASVQEALELAQVDYRLTVPEERRLRRLLLDSPNK